MIILILSGNMKIELATIQDVPALLDLQRKAFGPLCEELCWKDAPPLTESLEHAYEEFAQCTTLKVQNDEGHIICSLMVTYQMVLYILAV